MKSPKIEKESPHLKSHSPFNLPEPITATVRSPREAGGSRARGGPAPVPPPIAPLPTGAPSLASRTSQGPDRSTSPSTPPITPRNDDERYSFFLKLSSIFLTKKTKTKQR